MRHLALIAFAAALPLTSTPGEAAPKWIEDYCFKEAGKKSFNGRGEREQFTTNCIADLSAKPAKERRQYKKRYGY